MTGRVAEKRVKRVKRHAVQDVVDVLVEIRKTNGAGNDRWWVKEEELYVISPSEDAEGNLDGDEMNEPSYDTVIEQLKKGKNDS